MRAFLSIVLVIATIVGAVVAIPLLREFSAVDRCLDNGGSFDYAKDTCDFKANHPYAPHTDRHPFATPALLAAGAVVLCCGAGLIVIRVQRASESRAGVPAS